MPCISAFRERRHSENMSTLAFNIASKVCQSAPHAHVVIHQDVGSPWGYIALKGGWRDQAVESWSACVADPVVLNDLADADDQTEFTAENLSHGIRDRIEPCRLKGGHGQKCCRPSCKQVSKRQCRGTRQ